MASGHPRRAADSTGRASSRPVFKLRAPRRGQAPGRRAQNARSVAGCQWQAASGNSGPEQSLVASPRDERARAGRTGTVTVRWEAPARCNTGSQGAVRTCNPTTPGRWSVCASGLSHRTHHAFCFLLASKILMKFLDGTIRFKSCRKSCKDWVPDTTKAESLPFRSRRQEALDARSPSHPPPPAQLCWRSLQQPLSALCFGLARVFVAHTILRTESHRFVSGEDTDQ